MKYKNLTEKELTQFTRQYINIMLWTIGRYDLGSDDIDADDWDKCQRDCALFIKLAGELLADIDSEQVAHDFLLTRNGHGAGFWDRGLGEIGDKLTKLCEDIGEEYISCNYMAADEDDSDSVGFIKIEK